MWHHRLVGNDLGHPRPSVRSGVGHPDPPGLLCDLVDVPCTHGAQACYLQVRLLHRGSGYPCRPLLGHRGTPTAAGGWEGSPAYVGVQPRLQALDDRSPFLGPVHRVTCVAVSGASPQRRHVVLSGALHQCASWGGGVFIMWAMRCCCWLLSKQAHSRLIPVSPPVLIAHCA